MLQELEPDGSGRAAADAVGDRPHQQLPASAAHILERLEQQRHEMRRLEHAKAKQARAAHTAAQATEASARLAWSASQEESKDQELLEQVGDRITAVMMESLSESPIPSPQGTRQWGAFPAHLQRLTLQLARLSRVHLVP